MIRFGDTIQFIREIYQTENFIPLHEPRFRGNEKKYLEDCIDSTFVSSVGEFVDRFEKDMAEFTGAKHAVACMNGTAALHLALLLAGVETGDEVITQPLTFVATCNAISYLGAHPVFVDVDKDSMSLSPEKLKIFILGNYKRVNSHWINKHTKRPLKAIVPMHTFGLPGRLEDLIKLSDEYEIPLIEDAAESLGSYYRKTHTGTFGFAGTLSFNGNKVITTGGGGMLLFNDADLARRAKHLSTTAKVPHPWDYEHDHIAYNYRLPNLNAALGCAQLESLEVYLKAKRELSARYKAFFEDSPFRFVEELKGTRSNYWLNALILSDREEKFAFLEETNTNGVMTRPIWKLMNSLDMYRGCFRGDLENSEWLQDRVVNIPSSVVTEWI